MLVCVNSWKLNVIKSCYLILKNSFSRSGGMQGRLLSGSQLYRHFDIFTENLFPSDLVFSGFCDFDHLLSSVVFSGNVYKFTASNY